MADTVATAAAPAGGSVMRVLIGCEESGAVRVVPISRREAMAPIIAVHYLHRATSISYSFGLFRGDVFEGCVTFGKPSSAPLRSGIAGAAFAPNVLELNRLVLIRNIHNDATRLIGGAMKHLKAIGNWIIVSFADPTAGHVGTIYQAANFSYHGLSAKRTNWAIRGREGMHGQTIADEFRGHPSRVTAMREKYGDDFYLTPRPQKHRYLLVIGDRKFRRDARQQIRYPEQDMP